MALAKIWLQFRAFTVSHSEGEREETSDAVRVAMTARAADFPIDLAALWLPFGKQATGP